MKGRKLLNTTTSPSRRIAMLYRLLTRVSLHGFRKYVSSDSFLQNTVFAGCDAIQSDKVHDITSQKTAVLLREPPMCAIIFSVNFINASLKQNITLLVHHRSSLEEKLLFCEYMADTKYNTAFGFRATLSLLTSLAPRLHIVQQQPDRWHYHLFSHFHFLFTYLLNLYVVFQVK